MEQGRRGSGWLVVLAALLLVSSAGLGLGWWRLGAREDGGQRGGGEHSRAERGRVRSDWGRRFGPRGARARVSGRILDPRGQGLAFAEVCAFAETYPLRGLDDGAPRCVRADASGRYHLEDLWPVETHIHASARGFIAQRRRDPEHPRARIGLDLAPGEQREDVDIRLRRGGVAIRGRVLDLAGAPLADALVWVLGPAHSTSAGVAVTRSDAQGGFELWAARGPRTVVAWAGGQVHGQREVLAPDEGVALVLAPASVLEGRVVDARDGAPVPGALVSPGGHFGSGYDVRSDAEGRFRISALEPGDYRPAAKTRDRHGHAETLVALGLGERVTELEIRVRPGVTVRGRVELVESGLPCTHGSLRLHSRAHGEYAELDPRGRVELIGVPPGRYAVALSCRDAIPRPRYPDLLVRDDHVGGLRWEVIEGLKIRGQVVDERGRGIPGVPLRLRARLGGSVAELASREDEYSDERGNFVFAGLEPGRYAIALGPSTHRPGPAEPVVVELGARDLDDLRVVLPAAASLRGRTTDAAGAAWPGVEVDVWLVGDGGFESVRSDQSGRFRVAALRPGPLRLSAAAQPDEWSPRVPLAVLGPTELELRPGEVSRVALALAPAAEGRVEGRVVDAAGRGIPGALVDLVEVLGPELSATWRREQWSFPGPPTRSDAAGYFAFTGLRELDYMVFVHRPGGGEAIARLVSPGDELELVVFASAACSGRVRLADGSVPERFSVVLEDEAGEDRLQSFDLETEGAWALRGVPPGDYRLRIYTAAGYGERSLSLRAGESASGLDVLVSPRPRLRGRLVDLDSRAPVADRRLWLISRNDWSERSVPVETDADGRFELEGAPPGPVSLRIEGGRGYGAQTIPMRIEAHPLDQALGELAIVASRLGEGQRPGELGFALELGARFGERRRFVAMVDSVDPDGPAARAGLRPGQVIAAIDGHSLDSVDRYLRLTEVPAGARLALRFDTGEALTLVAE